MIRPVFTEVALFAAPFVIYVVYLWATRTGVFHPDDWSWSTIASLTIAALALMLASFLLIAHLSGSAPNSTYVPAHLENGRLVPGADK